MKKIVIIPTYNEKDNIEGILEAVMKLNGAYHVLVIDDGSPDGTAAIVRNLIERKESRLFLLERSGKLGLGTAYILGFQWALKNNYDYIFEMDADFSHNPNDLNRLFDACATGGADLSIGSRYTKGGKTENWPLDRQFYSKGGALFTRIITGMQVKDPTAGFICYKRDVLEKINLKEIRFVGYAFQIEMKFVAWKLGFRIEEVPITFIDRKIGISKMTKGIISEGVFGVIKIQLESLKANYLERHRNN